MWEWEEEGKKRYEDPLHLFMCFSCFILQVTEELLWELFVQAGPVGEFQTFVITVTFIMNIMFFLLEKCIQLSGMDGTHGH